MRRMRTLGLWTSLYSQFAVIFPYLVLEHRYFVLRNIELGGLMRNATELREGSPILAAEFLQEFAGEGAESSFGAPKALRGSSRGLDGRSPREGMMS